MERKDMSSREEYAPGAASGAEVRKDGEKWTLVLVRDLPHPPAKVWKALTDPEHLREWAPFDSDRNLGAFGTTSTVDSYRWALRAGTSASMCWIGFSPVSPWDASSAPRP